LRQNIREINVTDTSKACSVRTLDLASIGEALTVQHVQPPTAAPEWARWLEEIGFIVGERVMLMARGLPGGDPLVVRVAQSTFALRRAEAACIRVSPVDQSGVQEIQG
jgi:ferrous iron transport protein A